MMMTMMMVMVMMMMMMVMMIISNANSISKYICIKMLKNIAKVTTLLKDDKRVTKGSEE